MKRFAVVVAGGAGTRMGTEIPKQFLPLSGRPLLMYTLELFAGHTPETEIILVLPEAQISYWHHLCRSHSFDLKHTIIPGGALRGESVRNGINAIRETEALVAIHDGVRPFADSGTIEKAFQLASIYGAAVPVREISDSLRIIDGEGNSPFDRTKIRTVQTPQCFRLPLLREAYNGKDLRGYTDDAGLVGELGHPVFLFEGNPENIKITTPFDLLVAETLVRQRNL